MLINKKKSLSRRVSLCGCARTSRHAYAMLDFVGRMRIVRFMLWPWQQLTTCATITLYTCTYICNGALMAPCIMAWREAHGKDSLDCPLQAGLACRFFHGRPGGGPPAESTLFPPLGTCGAQAFPPCFGTGATVGRLPISWCIHPPLPPCCSCTLYSVRCTWTAFMSTAAHSSDLQTCSTPGSRKIPVFYGSLQYTTCAKSVE